MGYNILDVINKLILIKKKVKAMYENIAEDSISNYRLTVAANILVRYQDKHIQYYEKLKLKIKKDILEDIDFVIYDKISFLIDEYKNNIHMVESIPKDIEEILDMALEFQKKNGALIIDIQGRLIKKEADVETKTYSILSEILNREKTYIDDLKNVLENKVKKK